MPFRRLVDSFRFDLGNGPSGPGIVVDDALRKALSEPLPWDNIDCGVTKDFLKEEAQKALRASDAIAALRHAAIAGLRYKKNRLASRKDEERPDKEKKIRRPDKAAPQAGESRLRIRFIKRRGPVSFAPGGFNARSRAVNRSVLELSTPRISPPPQGLLRHGDARGHGSDASISRCMSGTGGE